MQRHGATCSIGYHSGTTHGQYDFASLSDMVAPYASCNGGDSDAAVGWSSPGDGKTTGCGNGGDERKTRRLASNRESAKRSRVRKQRRLDELSSRAARVRATNQRLVVELNRVIAEHGRVVRETARLREEASELRRKLDGMGVDETELAAPQSTEDTPEILL